MKKPKQHTTPCAECPFRRTSARGWLGGYTPAQFQQVQSCEIRLPCHMRMMKHGATYAEPRDAPQCAGRSAYWANQLKVPRREDILRLPPDREAVFSWPAEFLDHHLNGVLTEVADGED